MRAAAVTALAKFGVGQKDAEVKRSVEVLQLLLHPPLCPLTKLEA